MRSDETRDSSPALPPGDIMFKADTHAAREATGTLSRYFLTSSNTTE